MFLKDQNRRVLPRWRDYRTTLALGELSRPSSANVTGDRDEAALQQRRAEWEENRTLWHAADLVSSAFVVGGFGYAEDAARFVLDRAAAAPAPLVSIANEILGTGKADHAPAERDVGPGDELGSDELVRNRIRVLRSRVRFDPRDAISWVDLARLYKIAGEHEKSMHCMVVATRLGPDNRFVIRAAARLFLHEREGLRALRLIRRAAGANSDPWLLAAEIATASAAGYPSLFAKVARSHSEDTSVSLFHRTELTSALATLDLENGKDRLARKLFRTSLKQPNENSLAQAEWANRQLGGLKVEEASLSTQRSFEARANLCAAQGSWIAAAEQGLKWFRDQPFAKRPAMFTSYVSSLIGEYSVSEQLLRRSLQINPNDPDLINNLAFAIASDDRPEEAAPYLKKINLATMSGTSLVTLLATHGLVLFRQHEDVEGRNLYRKAIDAAGNIGALKYKILATLYLAREEILCRSESWHDTFNEALRVSAKSEESDIKTVREQVISLGAGLQQRTSGGKSAAQ